MRKRKVEVEHEAVRKTVLDAYYAAMNTGRITSVNDLAMYMYMYGYLTELIGTPLDVPEGNDDKKV